MRKVPDEQTYQIIIHLDKRAIHKAMTVMTALTLAGLLAYSWPAVARAGLSVFSAGQPISASAVNDNFTQLDERLLTYEDVVHVGDNGHLGIGQPNPDDMLHIKGGELTYAQIENDDASLRIGVGGGSAHLDWTAPAEGNQMTFTLNDTALLNLRGDGVVEVPSGGRLHVDRELDGHHNVQNGASIAKARSAVMYLVIVSNNYDTGAAVQGGAYMVLLNYEATTVVSAFQFSSFNNHSATFYVEDGQLKITDLPPGNNHVAVFAN